MEEKLVFAMDASLVVEAILAVLSAFGACPLAVDVEAGVAEQAGAVI